MSEKRISEISCPLCPAVFRAKRKPRTLEQWKASLKQHLIASHLHYLRPQEAEGIVNSYLNSIKEEE
jgi:hypothetical protein